jgi:2',5'-phosphodiesterase
VVTYNILADQYAATDAAKNVIFAHCPPQYLDPAYRRPLVLAELLGFNADVVCLQEVDEKMFSACLTPQLAQEGAPAVQLPGGTPERQHHHTGDAGQRARASSHSVLRPLASGESAYPFHHPSRLSSPPPPILFQASAVCTPTRLASRV